MLVDERGLSSVAGVGVGNPLQNTCVSQDRTLLPKSLQCILLKMDSHKGTSIWRTMGT